MGEPELDDTPDLDDQEPSAAADRASKSKPGSSKRRRNPKGSFVSRLASADRSNSGKYGGSVSPGQCSQALYAVHVTEATALRSEVELERSDFDVEGEAFAYFANNTFPPARLLVRGAPLFIVLAEEIRHQRRILEAVPRDVYWRRFLGRKPQTGWQPEVVPSYEEAV
jgi:hypothetical protein